MTSIGFQILYSLTFVITLFIMVLCLKSHKKHHVRFAVTLFIASIVNLFYLIFLAVDNEGVKKTFFMLTLISEDWLMFSLLGFVVSYIGDKRNKIFSTTLFFLVIISNIFLLVNLGLSFSGTIYLSNFFSGFYDGFRFKWPFIIRLILDWGMAFFAILALCYKSVKAPKIYKIKYVSILILSSIVLISNFVIMLYNFKYDFSILLFSVVAVFVFLFSFSFSPLYLKLKLSQMLVYEMDDAVLIFDAYNAYFYSNQKVLDLLDNKLSTLDSFNEAYPMLKDQTEKPQIINKDGILYYVEIIKKEIRDTKERLQATIYILRDVTFKEEQNKLRKYQLTHDDLTKAYNRSSFTDSCEKELMKNLDLKYQIITTNFSGFRLINDIYGTKIGNQILIKTADLLKELNHTIPFYYARMGADKFAVFISEASLKEYDFHHLLYNKVIKLIEGYPLKFKLGIANVIDKNISQSYERALMTIHYMDQKFNEDINFYSETVREKSIREYRLLTDLDEGIKNGQFKIYFQPQINSHDESIVGAEALVRWVHPTLGFISPGEFIPLFEKNMVISSLDLFVWEEALKFLKKWSMPPFDRLSVSVNISPKDFYQIDVCKTINDLVKKYDINPSRLKLEITESAFVSDQKMFISKIKELQKSNYIIEMDDFGSGYSSFNTLKDIPIDVLKLDMKFLDGDISNIKTTEILNSVIAMAHRIHLPVIAEGVETSDQCKCLSEMDCDFIQGYYYSKPMPKEEFENYIQNRKIIPLMDFWKDAALNKEIFTIVKEMKNTYDNFPEQVLLLKEIQSNVFKIYYANPNFLKSKNLEFQDIYGKDLSLVIKGDTNKTIKFIEDIYKYKSFIQNEKLNDGKIFNVSGYLTKNNYIIIIYNIIDC